MKIINKPIAWGAILLSVVSSLLFPFLKAPIVGKWNLYQTEPVLFFITIAILAIASIVIVSSKAKLLQITAYSLLLWNVISFLGVYFTITNYFGLKFVDNLLSTTMHLQWGWIPYGLASVVLLAMVRKSTN